MKRLSVVALFIAVGFAQQNPRAYYEELAKANGPASFEEALRVAKDVGSIPKDQAQELLPALFAAIASDTDGTKHAILGLHAISRRPDAGEVLKPRMKDIAALLSRTDPAMKASAGQVLMNIQPTPPEAPGILLGFINGPTGTVNEKIDALVALSHLRAPPRAPFETAAIQILGHQLPVRTLIAAINAATYPGATDRLTQAIAQHLEHPDWQVRLQAILAIKHCGPDAVGRHRAAIAKLANDNGQVEPVRTIAQITLDGKEEPRCVMLQTHPAPKFEPIPGCK